MPLYDICDADALRAPFHSRISRRWEERMECKCNRLATSVGLWAKALRVSLSEDAKDAYMRIKPLMRK